MNTAVHRNRFFRRDTFGKAGKFRKLNSRSSPTRLGSLTNQITRFLLVSECIRKIRSGKENLEKKYICGTIWPYTPQRTNSSVDVIYQQRQRLFFFLLTFPRTERRFLIQKQNNFVTRRSRAKKNKLVSTKTLFCSLSTLGKERCSLFFLTLKSFLFFSFWHSQFPGNGRSPKHARAKPQRTFNR